MYLAAKSLAKHAIYKSCAHAFLEATKSLLGTMQQQKDVKKATISYCWRGIGPVANYARDTPKSLFFVCTQGMKTWSIPPYKHWFM